MSWNIAGIFDALEAEDYDGAINAITSMKPVPTPVPVTKVDITMDNYLDYFDIVTESTYDLKDAHGNLFYRDRETFLKLKDQYSCNPEDPGEITVGVDYAGTWAGYKGINCDFDSFTSSDKARFKDKRTGSDLNTSFVMNEETSARCYLECLLYNEFAQTEKDDNFTWIQIVTSYEIINVSGTINLLNN